MILSRTILRQSSNFLNAKKVTHSLFPLALASKGRSTAKMAKDNPDVRKFLQQYLPTVDMTTVTERMIRDKVSEQFGPINDIKKVIKVHRPGKAYRLIPTAHASCRCRRK